MKEKKKKKTKHAKVNNKNNNSSLELLSYIHSYTHAHSTVSLTARSRETIHKNTKSFGIIHSILLVEKNSEFKKMAEALSSFIKLTIPNYLSNLPIPDSFSGWFKLGGKSNIRRII